MNDMNNTSNTSIKSKVIILLYRARQQQQEFVDGLSEAERNAVGTLEHWMAAILRGKRPGYQ